MPWRAWAFLLAAPALGCGAGPTSVRDVEHRSVEREHAPAPPAVCREWIALPVMVGFPWGEAVLDAQGRAIVIELARMVRERPDVDGVYLVGAAHHRADRDPTPALGMARARTIAEWLFGERGGVPVPPLVITAGALSTHEPCAGWKRGAKKCSAAYRYVTLAVRVARACEPGEQPAEPPPPGALRPDLEQIEEAIWTPDALPRPRDLPAADRVRSTGGAP